MKAMQYGHPKFRIKIPRLLVVVTNIQRKLQFHFKDKPTAISNDGTNKAKHGGGSFLISRKSLGSVIFNKRSSKVRENELGRALGNKPVVAALSQLLALEESLEHIQNRKDKRHVMMKLPLLRFLEKKKGWKKFMRAKSRTMFTRLRQLRRKTCSCRLFKIPSKIMVVGLKLRMVRPLVKKQVTKKGDVGNGDKEDEGMELWKKRILMGRRCKPLSSPGTLGYDTESCLFLPEIAP